MLEMALGLFIRRVVFNSVSDLGMESAGFDLIRGEDLWQ